MSKMVAIDEEVLQYLCQTALSHHLIMQALLGLEELRSPGVADTILASIDTSLGKRTPLPVDPGWVSVRARLREDLDQVYTAQHARGPTPIRDKVWEWLTGWRAQRRPR